MSIANRLSAPVRALLFLMLLAIVQGQKFVTYEYSMEATFRFQNAIVEPIGGGVSEVVRLAQGWFLEVICSSFSRSCFETETSNGFVTASGSSNSFDANFITVRYILKTSFFLLSEPSVDAVKAVLEGADRSVYLRNFVNVVDPALSPNFFM